MKNCFYSQLLPNEMTLATDLFLFTRVMVEAERKKSRQTATVEWHSAAQQKGFITLVWVERMQPWIRDPGFSVICRICDREQKLLWRWAPNTAAVVTSFLEIWWKNHLKVPQKEHLQAPRITPALFGLFLSVNFEIKKKRNTKFYLYLPVITKTHVWVTRISVSLKCQTWPFHSFVR